MKSTPLYDFGSGPRKTSNSIVKWTPPTLRLVFSLKENYKKQIVKWIFFGKSLHSPRGRNNSQAEVAYGASSSNYKSNSSSSGSRCPLFPKGWWTNQLPMNRALQH